MTTITSLRDITVSNSRTRLRWTSWLIVVVCTLLGAGSGIGNAHAQSIEKKPATVGWQSYCTNQSYPTPAAALATYTQCSSKCAVYSGTGIQVSPNEYHAQVTVFQQCATQSEPVTFYTTGIVGTGSCSTPYVGDPDGPYNSPGYIYAPPENGYPFGYCYINLALKEQTKKPSDNCLSNPIMPGTGNKRQEETDYSELGDGGLVFKRIYNSAPQYGGSWMHSYDRSISVTPITLRSIVSRVATHLSSLDQTGYPMETSITNCPAPTAILS